MRLFILALILAPSLSQAYVLSCGARMGDGREIGFQMFPAQMTTAVVDVSFGHLRSMQTQKISVTKTQRGFGLWKKESFKGKGFALENRGGGEYVFTANVPSIGLNVTSLPIYCIEYQ